LFTGLWGSPPGEGKKTKNAVCVCQIKHVIPTVAIKMLSFGFLRLLVSFLVVLPQIGSWLVLVVVPALCFAFLLVVVFVVCCHCVGVCTIVTRPAGYRPQTVESSESIERSREKSPLFGSEVVVKCNIVIHHRDKDTLLSTPFLVPMVNTATTNTFHVDVFIYIFVSLGSTEVVHNIEGLVLLAIGR
jgi:hypothetical protein